MSPPGTTTPGTTTPDTAAPDKITPGTITLNVNGVEHQVRSPAGMRLSEVLREELRLTGTKVGCNAGDCGACTVTIDDDPYCACLITAAQAGGRRVATVEGLTESGELSALQKSFLQHGAAQCGICTPGMLMAAAALLKQNKSPARAEVEDALGGVLCRCTGYSKIVDAVMDLGRRPVAAPDAGSAVGSRIVRLDGVPKVNGDEVFGADYWPQDALYVRAIRSPHHRAGFSFGDLKKWQARHAAVSHVFTAGDIDGENCFGVLPHTADQPVLAEGAVRFRGEAVALIAGNEEVAALNVSDFPVAWRELPATLNINDAQAAGAPLLHEGRSGNILIRGAVRHGRLEDGFASADVTAELERETGYVEHAYIEPEAGVAWMDEDVLTVQACTQAPVLSREGVAQVLGYPLEKVRVIPSATGGGFGSKLDLSVQPLVGLVTLKTGRAARMVYSRNESMTSTTKRHPGKMSARAAAGADGTVTAMEFHGDFNTGAYASWGPTVAIRVPVHASGPYRTPHYYAEARAIHTNGTPAGAFRGFGVPQATIIQEALYDRLADECGIDRLEFRLINALRDGDKTVCGQELHGVGIVDCLAALKPFWKKHNKAAAAHNEKNSRMKQGLGVASCWYGCGNTGIPNPSTIRLGVTRDGTVVLHQGAADIGQGSNTVIAQICADSLGVPVAGITLVGGDTALTPDCGKTSASRQTFITGRASEMAGQALRREILRLCNMGADAEIDIMDGRIEVAGKSGPKQNLDLLRLDENSFGYVLMAEETYNPDTEALDENGQGRPYEVYGYGAQAVLVEVDTLLGVVRVLKISAAHDLGRVINPTLAEGQIDGGIAQGLGMALMEEFIPGRTENLHDYLIPSIGDMPKIEHHLIEVPDPAGPMGAKGLGEHVLIPTAPAILNAIRHAAGAEITRLPALPHRVLEAIQTAQAENGVKH